MRLAFVSTFLPQQCGIATYTDYLVRGLRKADPDLEITVLAEDGAEALRDGNLTVVPCWNRREDYVKQILSRTDDIDILHIQHEYGIYSFDERLPTLLDSLPDTIGKVVTIHCVRPAQVSERGPVDEEYAREIAERADHVILHLPSQRAILERLGIPREKISVIAHGTELSDEDPIESRRRLDIPEDARIMLMFGFVKPHKCLHVAVEALRKIIDEGVDARLFVAGGLASNANEEARRYVDTVRERIAELRLQESVIFPNRFYPNEDVPYLFRACDVVLFPYYEGDRSASGSLHLAIGAARPVIASRIPKFVELANISDELLILPHNSDELAQLALRLFTDSEFNKYITRRTEEYREQTSWKKTAQRHLEVYEKVKEESH